MTPTATEFSKNFTTGKDFETTQEYISSMLIEFAKLHVDSALNKANENVRYDYSDIESIQHLILTSYPLDCIV